MRKTLLYTVLLTVLSLFTGYGKAHAESPYKCDFNTTISTDKNDFKVATGWGHVVNGYFCYDDYDTYYVSYTYSANGGIDGSGALEVGDQTAVGPSMSYDTGSTTDLLVTPKLNGASSIYVKKTKASGTVKFYKVTKSGISYSRGSQISVTLPTLSTDEFVKVEIPEQTDAYVGIYGSCVIFDNFEADDADVTPVKGLTVTGVTNNSGSTVDCDADNNFTLNFTATIMNTGDVVLNPGDEGYSLSIVNYSRDNAVISTTSITEALAVGATTTVNITGTAAYADYPDRNRYDVMENISQTSKMAGWIEFKPYLPAVSLRSADNTKIEAGATIDYGRTTESVTKTFTLNNTGAAPLNLTAITLPEGFSTNVTFPLNIAAGESSEINIKLDADKFGVFFGDVTFKVDNIDDFVFKVNGIVMDPSKYYVDFEDNKIPTGAIAEESWSVAGNGTSDNRYSLSHGSRGDGTETKFITPLLKVTEGEVMTVDVARTNFNSYGSDIYLKVYYSADRKTWTEVKSIASTELSGTRIDYNKYISKFTTFTIEGVPAGNYYIGFGACYTTIDNIYGFEKVDVAHDWLITSAEVAASGMVNKEYTAKATVKNNNDKEVEADSYTATLYVGRQAIASETVPAIAAGASQDFVFNFTPNTAGTFDAYVVFKDNNDDYTVSTDAVELTIAEEAATDVKQIGEIVIKSNGDITTGNYAPLGLSYYNSESQSVYTAEQLGLKNGDKIGSLTWKGYNSSADLTTNIKVYIANVDYETLSKDGFEGINTEGMTKVYEGSYTFKMDGSSKNTVDLLSVNIAEPFVYDGTNLCIVVQSSSDKWKANNFEVTNISDQCVARRSDGDITKATYSNTNLPVVYLGVVKDPVVISGTVKDTNDDAIEGAVVTMKSDDVIYTATTDAEGAYSLNVIQKDLTYDLTVAAAGYETVTESGITPETTDAKNFSLTALETETGTISAAGYSTFSNLNRAAQITDAEVYTAKLNGTTLTLTKVEDGKVPANTGVILKGTEGSVTTYTVTYGVSATELTNNDLIAAKAETVGNGNICVLAKRDGVVGFYTLADNNKVGLGKAYIELPAGSEAKALTFEFAETTGITEIESADADGKMYNLLGQPVNRATAKGIVIKNGKKYILK